MRSSILMIVMVTMFIGCSDAKGGGNSTTPGNIKNKTMKQKAKKVTNTAGSYEDYIVPIVEIDLDDLTFEDAFSIEYRGKGEGHTFWWRGDEYTTDLYANMPIGNYKWVKNSEDIDDSCQSNILDECGVCDGRGMNTWYIDLDGDGLGDPNVHTKTCTYPSVDEE